MNLPNQPAGLGPLSRLARAAVVALALPLCLPLAACGEDVPVKPLLKVEVFGWGPTGNGASGFVQGLPPYADARTVRVRVTQPLDGRVLSNETFDFASREARLPEVPFGENLRLEMECLNNQGAIVATGATPIFSLDRSVARRGYRLMVAPVNTFAPAGSIVADSQTGQPKVVQSRMDGRGFAAGGQSGPWLGRIGHADVALSDGRVIIVGGADLLTVPAPAQLPSIRTAHRDIQIFDPATGYFTELAVDEPSIALGVRGVDRLSVGRAFHTVTPLGQDRFLVAGGFTLENGQLRAVSKVEILDMRAAAGTRVQTLVNNGVEVALQTPRAMHTTTYRPLDGAIIVAGGVGNAADNNLFPTDVLNSFEVISVPARSHLGSGALQQARTQHAAVLMADGRTVWLLGGRSATGVLNATEVVELQGDITASRATLPLNQPRFGLSAVRLAATSGQDVMVLGGFTTLNGEVSGSYEIGGLSRDRFFTQASWQLAVARGNARAVELPYSGDIVVIGGLKADRSVAREAERLTYRGLSEATPFVYRTGMGEMQEGRYGAGATLMSNGMVLVSGGMLIGAASALDHAEVYNALEPVRARSR